MWLCTSFNIWVCKYASESVHVTADLSALYNWNMIVDNCATVSKSVCMVSLMTIWGLWCKCYV